MASVYVCVCIYETLSHTPHRTSIPRIMTLTDLHTYLREVGVGERYGILTLPCHMALII